MTTTTHTATRHALGAELKSMPRYASCLATVDLVRGCPHQCGFWAKAQRATQLLWCEYLGAVPLPHDSFDISDLQEQIGSDEFRIWREASTRTEPNGDTERERVEVRWRSEFAEWLLSRPDGVYLTFRTEAA